MTKGSQARRQKKLNEKVVKKAAGTAEMPGGGPPQNPFDVLAGAILTERKNVAELAEKLELLAKIHDQNSALFQQTLQALELETIINRRLLVDNGVELEAIEHARVSYVDEWYAMQGLAAFAAAARVHLERQALLELPVIAPATYVEEEQNPDYNTVTFGG